MRHLTLIIIFTITVSVNAQTNDALIYMNEIFAPVDNIKNNTWQYLKAITRGKGARKVENKRQSLLSELKETKYIVKKAGAYHSDYSLRDAVVKYLEISYIVLREDFDKILDMEDIAEQSYDLMEAYLLAKEKANDKLDYAFDSVVIAQELFASNNNITLHEADKDKRTEKIKRASETLKYYNEIYLIFFKVYKQEAYVLDAMQRTDINGLEQNTNTLAMDCEEGLEKLKTMKGFRGDASLKVATQRILNFYKKEATEDFPAMTDFFIKKENYEQIQKAFEAKSKRERTQEDINKLNNAGNEYNAAASEVNAINSAINKSRAKHLNEWNSRVENFFELHAK